MNRPRPPAAESPTVPHRGRANADDIIAAALAAGRTHQDAATAAGVSAKTVFRRAADPAFKARVAELRSALVRSAAGRLADGMAEAAGVLRALLGNDDPHIRHKAAVKVIELGVKVADLAELEARIGELEASRGSPGELP